MNLSSVPVWAWVSGILMFGGLLLSLQGGSTRRRLTGLLLCQASVFLACLWGWGILSIGATEPAAPTAKAACWVLGSSMLLTFFSAWILGRRPWAEGLLASRSPKPGHRRQL